MHTDTLRLFIEVADNLSFVAVAERRDVNPSSISRAISTLETNLGVRLLNRTTRTMSLTEAGAIYRAEAKTIIDAIDQAEERVQGINAIATGTLRLTASIAFGERLLVPLLADFNARYPGVQLELLFTDANVDLVNERVDLAIRLAPAVTGDVVAARLFRTRYRVVASPSYLARNPKIKVPSNLAQHNCSVFALRDFRSQWLFRSREQDQSAEPEAVTINSGIAVSSALSLRSIVLSGGGPALLADWLIDEDVAAKRLVDVLPDYEATATDFVTSAWLVYPKRDFLPNKVRVAIDFLRERLAQTEP